MFNRLQHHWENNSIYQWETGRKIKHQQSDSHLWLFLAIHCLPTLSDLICMESQRGRWYKRRNRLQKRSLKSQGLETLRSQDSVKWFQMGNSQFIVWTITYSDWALTWPRAWNLMNFNMSWKWAHFQEKAKCNLCLSFKSGSDSRRGSPMKQIKVSMTMLCGCLTNTYGQGTQSAKGKKGPHSRRLHSR